MTSCTYEWYPQSRSEQSSPQSYIFGETFVQVKQ